jgi:hypothetical protein
VILSRRRALIGGLSALFVAPAIVRASSLMPIKVQPPTHDPVWYLDSNGMSEFTTDGLRYLPAISEDAVLRIEIEMKKNNAPYVRLIDLLKEST